MAGLPPVVLGGAAAVTIGVVGLVWMVGGARRLPAPAAHYGDARRSRLSSGAAERVLRPAVGWVARRARRMTPGGWMESLERRVRLVGSGGRWTLDRVLAGKLMLGVGGGLTGFWYGGQRSTGAMMVFAVAGAFAGFLVIDLILWGRARERQLLIRRSLPDTLDQMTICVESGLGFDAALQRVGGRGEGPLAEELQTTLKEMSVGVPRRDALDNLVERTDVPELRHFVLAVRQADEYGLPVARVLRVQSTQLRVRRRQAAEERAMKMPVKIVFPLVLCIFPALFVVLLGPAVIRIMRTLF